MKAQYDRRVHLLAFAALTAVLLATPAVAGAAAAPTVISTRTGASTFLSDTGGVNTTVESIALPKGSWTITSNLTAIDFHAGDFVRCVLQNGGVTLDGGATAYLENTVADIANAATINAKAAVTVTVACEHDHNATTAGQFYVDPGATLMAVAGGPISTPKAVPIARGSGTMKAAPTVVQRRSTAQVPLSVQQTPYDVTSVRLGAGTWALHANLSAVSFSGFDFVSCELDNHNEAAGSQQVVVGTSDTIVSNLSLQAELVLTKTTTVPLICDTAETPNVYIDPGATLTATLIPTAADIVRIGAVGATLSDAGGVPTKVWHLSMPAGAWRVTSDATAWVKNPNGAIGGANDFVRCTLFDGKKAIDGSATVLINDVDSAGDGGNYEQTLLNTGTVTDSKPWTLSFSCSHDNAISTGQHWQVFFDSPVLAVQQGPIRSTVT